MRNHLKRHLSELPEGADEGFTLIELLVVLLILGILLAIAIPTFLTVTKSATNTAVTSNLQTALTGADTYYTQDGGSYTGLIATTGDTVSNLQQQGTGLSYVASTSATTGYSATTKTISVYAIDANDVVFAAWNGSTRCYAIADEKSTNGVGGQVGGTIGTYYGYSTVLTAANCNAFNVLTAVNVPTASAGYFTSTAQGGFPA